MYVIFLKLEIVLQLDTWLLGLPHLTTATVTISVAPHRPLGVCAYLARSYGRPGDGLRTSESGYPTLQDVPSGVPSPSVQICC